jgi:flagellar biosynthetic protein FliP
MNVKHKPLSLHLPVTLLLLACAAAGAQTVTADPQHVNLGLALEGGNFTRAVNIFLLVTALSLVPGFIVMMTSFTRIVIVLGFLRQAMGTQNAPSGRIVAGLALFLSAFIMQPVWNEIYRDAVLPFSQKELSEQEALTSAARPIKRFMLAQTREKSLLMFMDIAQEDPATSPDNLSIRIIAPAFMVSELQTAFQMGFLIFLPFLVIDAVTATFLMSMGMMMLPPMMISLPFKLLLFIIADGWNLVVEGLVNSFVY